MRPWLLMLPFALLLPAALPAAEPDSKIGQNAALKYWQAFTQMSLVLDKEGEKLLEDWSKSPLDSTTDKLLDSSQAVLIAFHRGAKIGPCDWSLDYEDGPGLLLPHLAKARDLTRLAALHARRELARRHPDAATADALDMLTLARHANSDFTLISILVRYANEAIVFEMLAPHLPELDTASLQKLAATMDALPGGFTIADSIRGEKEFMAGWLLRKLKEAEKEKPGSWRGAFKALLGEPDAADALTKIDSYEKAVKTTEDLMPVYDELVRLHALPPAEFDLMYPSFFKKTRAENPMASLLLPALEKVAAAQRRNQTQRALFRAAIAVVQGGPEKLKDVKDPFGDGPFTYRAFDGGFELKSRFKFKDQPVTLIVGREGK